MGALSERAGLGVGGAAGGSVVVGGGGVGQLSQPMGVNACHRPLHYGRKHSLLNVVIC
jgi:hypothetical protein